MRDLPESFHGLRYRSIGNHYKERFGHRVQKIALSVSQSCPNRLSDIGACVFCDEWGSAGIHVRAEMELKDQLKNYKEGMRDRYPTHHFLAYFQPYTTTFERSKQLESQINIALADPDVEGVILGTRPDCLNKSLLSMLEELAKKTYVCVELGIQSFNDEALVYLNRGHNVQTAIEGMHKLKALDNVEVGVHLIFGLPGETDVDTLAAVKQVNDLKFDNVKLHNLHVLKNTPLELAYNKGEFVPWEMDRYTDAVVLFLEHCAPEIAISRLAAKATRSEELIAPEWSSKKMLPINAIEKKLQLAGTWQGCKYIPSAG